MCVDVILLLCVLVKVLDALHVHAYAHATHARNAETCNRHNHYETTLQFVMPEVVRTRSSERMKMTFVLGAAVARLATDSAAVHSMIPCMVGDGVRSSNG